VQRFSSRRKLFSCVRCRPQHMKSVTHRRDDAMEHEQLSMLRLQFCRQLRSGLIYDVEGSPACANQSSTRPSKLSGGVRSNLPCFVISSSPWLSLGEAFPRRGRPPSGSLPARLMNLGHWFRLKRLRWADCRACCEPASSLSDFADIVGTCKASRPHLLRRRLLSEPGLGAGALSFSRTRTGQKGTTRRRAGDDEQPDGTRGLPSAA